MKPTSLLVSLGSFAPISLYGVGADEASRPSPPGESQAVVRPSDTPSKDGAVKAGDHDVLLESLRGLAIAPTAEMALELQGKIQAGSRVEGFSAHETREMQRIVDRAIGKPVSLNSLAALTAELENVYQRSGQAFVQVSFPQQEITGGVIALQIAQARAGEVKVSGNPAFSAEFSANAFRTKPGQAISGDIVFEDLEWLNENPLRRASISYNDGATPEVLDLNLRVRATKPWRAYAGIDNQLSENLGDERIFLGFQHGDLFGLDHRLTAQYTSALEFKNLQGFSGIYEIPLPIRHLLQTSIGYTESESDSAGPIDQSGEFSRAALSYRIPLPRWRATSHEWRIGAEFRNNDYLFSNDTSATVKFFQLETGWKGKRFDRYGYSRLDASFIYSPGQGVLGSEDEDFIALGADGAESFVARIEMERTLKLAKAGTFIWRMQGQWADSNLLSSDQISAGGVNRVRGFDETVGYASRGVISSLEIQSRSFQTPQAGDFTGFTFLDAAFLDRENIDDAGQLAAVGAGVSWRLDEMISAKVSYAIPIDYPDDENVDPMLHFSITTSW